MSAVWCKVYGVYDFGERLGEGGFCSRHGNDQSTLCFLEGPGGHGQRLGFRDLRGTRDGCQH